MGIWTKIKGPLEAAEHIHFVELILSALGVKTLLTGLGAGVLTLFAAAADGQSVTVVMLAALLAAVGVALLVAIITVIVKLIRHRPTPAAIEAASPPIAGGPLEIHVAEGGAFFDVPKHNLYSMTRRLKLEVRNSDRSKTMTDAKVQITKIEPYCGYRPPWVLLEKFSLAAGDQTYISIAQLGEARDQRKFDCGDDTIEVCCEGKAPLLGTEHENILTVRATGHDIPYTEVEIRVWKDGAGRLRIAKLGEVNTELPLLEAATRAYEHTRHDHIATFARVGAKTPEDILRWYCYALIIPRNHKGGGELMPVFGYKPPSRMRDRIAVQNGHAVVITQNGVNLTILGEDDYADLVVHEADLDAAINTMKSWADEDVTPAV